MTRPFLSTLKVLATAATLVSAHAASAQESGSPFSAFGRIFGGSDRAPAAEENQRVAQASPADLVVRIDRLEAQIRQLTGVIEQLQYRNQQLEAQLQRLQGAGAPQTAAVPPLARAPTPVGPSPSPTASAPAVAGRRNDAFDPAQNPNAPGAPQTLGTLNSGAPPYDQNPAVADQNVGAPGGRLPGSPLDLTTMGNPASPPTGNPAGPPTGNPVVNDPNAPPQQTNVLPPPPVRNPSSTGVLASVQPPSATPRDQFDLGYGSIQRKDYALAEDAFQTFLTKYPADKLAPDALFWLGEARFQRQRFDAAAESFLAVSTKYVASAKAPEAMLRLGQSLAALGQRDMACATLAEVTHKYPRASATVRQGVQREQKRARCG